MLVENDQIDRPLTTAILLIILKSAIIVFSVIIHKSVIVSFFIIFLFRLSQGFNPRMSQVFHPWQMAPHSRRILLLISHPHTRQQLM